MYLVVPHNSHATKSTSIPPKYTQNTPKSFDPSLRTKPNYPLSKLTFKLTQKPQQNTPSPHHLSPTLSNYPTPPKPLINPTQINKISPKTPHSNHTHTTHLSKFFLTTRIKTNPNKTLLKLRIIPHILKISTLN